MVDRLMVLRTQQPFCGEKTDNELCPGVGDSGGDSESNGRRRGSINLEETARQLHCPRVL